MLSFFSNKEGKNDKNQGETLRKSRREELEVIDERKRKRTEEADTYIKRTWLKDMYTVVPSLRATACCIHWDQHEPGYTPDTRAASAADTEWKERRSSLISETRLRTLASLHVSCRQSRTRSPVYVHGGLGRRRSSCPQSSAPRPSVWEQERGLYRWTTSPGCVSSAAPPPDRESPPSSSLTNKQTNKQTIKHTHVWALL